MTEFPFNVPSPSNVPSHPWPQSFQLHQLNPAFLHQHLLPAAYKMPNIHALISQYMNMNVFNYAHNLVGPRMTPPMVNGNVSPLRCSPLTRCSPLARCSPTLRESDN